VSFGIMALCLSSRHSLVVQWVPVHPDVVFVDHTVSGLCVG